MNKFTVAVDNLFDTFGQSKSKIFLCVMDEYSPIWDYFGYSGLNIVTRSNGIEPPNDLEDAFSIQLDVLISMLLDSFGDELDLDPYDHKVDIDYSCYVFVNRKHEIRAVLTDCGTIGDDSGDLLVDLNAFDEQAANRKHDEYLCGKISNYVAQINECADKLDSDEGKRKAADILSSLHIPVTTSSKEENHENC